MKNLKFYNNFITELYSDSSSNRASELLNKMVNMFAETFQGQNDMFSQNELETISFIDIERSNYNDAFEKNILMNFEDDVSRYQIFFVIKLDDIISNKPIEKAYIIIKIYENNAENTTPNQFKYNVDMKLPNEDEMLKEGRFYVKIKEIKNEDSQSQSQSQNENFIFIEEFIINKIGKMSELKK
jgi:hypothetical protein